MFPASARPACYRTLQSRTLPQVQRVEHGPGHWRTLLAGLGRVLRRHGAAER